MISSQPLIIPSVVVLVILLLRALRNLKDLCAKVCLSQATKLRLKYSPTRGPFLPSTALALSDLRGPETRSPLQHKLYQGSVPTAMATLMAPVTSGHV